MSNTYTKEHSSKMRKRRAIRHQKRVVEGSDTITLKSATTSTSETTIVERTPEKGFSFSYYFKLLSRYRRHEDMGPNFDPAMFNGFAYCAFIAALISFIVIVCNILLLIFKPQHTAELLTIFLIFEMPFVILSIFIWMFTVLGGLFSAKRGFAIASTILKVISVLAFITTFLYMQSITAVIIFYSVALCFGILIVALLKLASNVE